MRPIDADKLERDMVEKVFDGDSVYKVFGYSSSQIKAAPTISYSDIVPHGRWKDGCQICPICGMDKFSDLDADIWSDWKPKFCPNCGAKMDMKG